jgi:hypothetical protein
MSEKEGTKRLTIHFYPGTKRTDLGTKRLGYETFCTLPDYCASDFLQFNHVLVFGVSFPVQGIKAISDVDLVSKYCYFYHSSDFVPY